MALTLVDNRIVLSEADTATGWTGSTTVATGAADPDPVEATNWLGMAVSQATEDAYVSITSDDYSAGGTVSVWVQDNGAMDTLVNGGVQIVVGDGSNRVGYHVGGSDATGFRHNDGPVKWTNFVLDLANKPVNFTTYAGSETLLNEAAITEFGVAFKTLAKAKGGTTNCFWDIGRFADNAVGIETYGGTSGTPESLATLATEDRNTGNLRGHGVIRELAAGVYGIQGNVNLGDVTSTNDTYIDITNETLAWEERVLSAANYYRFTIAGNATGVTEVNIKDSVLSVSGTASASFDVSDANVDTFTANGSVFSGFDQGITTGSTGQTWNGDNFIECGTITLNSVLTNCNISNSVAASAVVCDTLADLDNCSFTSDGSNHAVELTSIGGGTMVWDNTLTGYDTGVTGSPVTPTTTGNEAIFVNVGTGTLTINVATGATTPSIRSAGATVNVVAGQVTTTVQVNDDTGSPIQGALVRAEAADGTGPLPYQTSVSMTRFGPTVTVTHSSHGLSTNQYVRIAGATETEYNGVWQITVTGTNTYTFNIGARTPSSPATGSPTSTGILVYGTSDVNGEVSDTRSLSSSQPVIGVSRKSSSAPFYKQGTISGIASNSANTTLTTTMVSDE